MTHNERLENAIAAFIEKHGKLGNRWPLSEGQMTVSVDTPDFYLVVREFHDTPFPPMVEVYVNGHRVYIEDKEHIVFKAFMKKIETEKTKLEKLVISAGEELLGDDNDLQD